MLAHWLGFETEEQVEALGLMSPPRTTIASEKAILHQLTSSYRLA
jgi:hypothetical protein